jgi:hypothetical protein
MRQVHEPRGDDFALFAETEPLQSGAPEHGKQVNRSGDSPVPKWLGKRRRFLHPGLNVERACSKPRQRKETGAAKPARP